MVGGILGGRHPRVGCVAFLPFVGAKKEGGGAAGNPRGANSFSLACQLRIEGGGARWRSRWEIGSTGDQDRVLVSGPTCPWHRDARLGLKPVHLSPSAGSRAHQPTSFDKITCATWPLGRRGGPKFPFYSLGHAGTRLERRPTARDGEKGMLCSFMMERVTWTMQRRAG